MNFVLGCPHCGHVSIGQIRYLGTPDADYYEDDKVKLETVGRCIDCNGKVQIIEYATIDKIEVEKY